MGIEGNKACRNKTDTYEYNPQKHGWWFLTASKALGTKLLWAWSESLLQASLRSLQNAAVETMGQVGMRADDAMSALEGLGAWDASTINAW
eukprot:2933814-Amphidinium_carterae.1